MLGSVTVRLGFRINLRLPFTVITIKPFCRFLTLCQSMQRCLVFCRPQKYTFVWITATLNAGTRKIARFSVQGAGMSPRRLNFRMVPSKFVGPQYETCFVSSLWLQERCGGTQIFFCVGNLCNHVPGYFPSRRPWVPHSTETMEPILAKQDGRYAVMATGTRTLWFLESLISKWWTRELLRCVQKWFMTIIAGKRFTAFIELLFYMV